MDPDPGGTKKYGWILGSVQRTYGSGSCSGSCSFHQWPSICINFAYCIGINNRVAWGSSTGAWGSTTGCMGINNRVCMGINNRVAWGSTTGSAWGSTTGSTRGRGQKNPQWELRDYNGRYTYMLPEKNPIKVCWILLIYFLKVHINLSSKIKSHKEVTKQ